MAMSAKSHPRAARLARLRRRAAASVAVLAAAAASAVSIAATSASASPSGEPSTSAAAAVEPTSIEPTLSPAPQVVSSQETTATHADGLGIAPGKIKHVWLIILENKSYDATFTGLNNNTYLWKTLPSQGVLLKNYYGTGHFSLDNYISMVSGQATQPDTQADCPDYDNFSGTVDLSGNAEDEPELRAGASRPRGRTRAAGTNGCVYPSERADAVQPARRGRRELEGLRTGPRQPRRRADPDARRAARSTAAPRTQRRAATGSTADQPNPGSANATDQYVPKHFPFPWFESILQSGDCNAAHIANLFDPTNGLYHDLQSEATTPAFSWISPNNCSDAHDAVCHGNNLSGGFIGPEHRRTRRSTTPAGLYAADLFLEHVVPEIEASPAFKDGGLIDITFDEGFPPFTYTGNSFANSTTVSPNAAASIAADSAGETLFGATVTLEPTGPNTPLATDASGNELYPGPGDNAFIDRPSSCVAQTVPSRSRPAPACSAAAARPGRAHATPARRRDRKALDDLRQLDRRHRRGPLGDAAPASRAGAFVGQVTDTPVTADRAPTRRGGFVDTGSFTLVDANGATAVDDRRR